MTGKTFNSSSAAKSLNYIFNDKGKARDEAGILLRRGRIIGGNMAGEYPEDLSREFDAVTGLKANTKHPITHHILTFAPEDQKHLNERKMAQIADDYMKQRGYGNTMYVAVAHYDTNNPHLHLLSSTVDFDGKAISQWRSKQKDFAVCRELEKKYGLRQLADRPRNKSRRHSNRHEQGYAERTGNPTVRETIQNAIDKSLVEKNFSIESPTDFIKVMESQGISVRQNLDKDGKPNGISFAKKSHKGKLIAFKGGSLGRKYVWSRLSKRISKVIRKSTRVGQKDVTLRQSGQTETARIYSSSPSKPQSSQAKRHVKTSKLIVGQMRKILSEQKISVSKPAWKRFKKDLRKNFSQQKPSVNQLKLIDKLETARNNHRSVTNVQSEAHRINQAKIAVSRNHEAKHKMTRLEAIQLILTYSPKQQQEALAKTTMGRYENQQKEHKQRKNAEKKNKNEKQYTPER